MKRGDTVIMINDAQFSYELSTSADRSVVLVADLATQG